MDTEAPKLSIFFLPFVGGGHLIPMIDLARVFSTHNVKSTILAIPNDTSVFQSTITRDQQTLGLDIHLLTLQLPFTDQPHALTAVDMSASPFTDTSIVQQPLVDLLRRYRPDCIVTDTFHRWAADAVDGVGVPRVLFNGNCCFARCCEESVKRDWPHEKVGSDFEPFVLEGLPDRIELTRSQLPIFIRTRTEFPGQARNFLKTVH